MKLLVQYLLMALHLPIRIVPIVETSAIVPMAWRKFTGNPTVRPAAVAAISFVSADMGALARGSRRVSTLRCSGFPGFLFPGRSTTVLQAHRKDYC